MSVSRFYEDFGYVRRVILNRNTYNPKDICFDTVQCISDAISDNRTENGNAVAFPPMLPTAGASPPLKPNEAGHFWEVDHHYTDDTVSTLILKNIKKQYDILIHGIIGNSTNDGQLYIGFGYDLKNKFAGLYNNTFYMHASDSDWSGLRNFNGSNESPDTSASKLVTSRSTIQASIHLRQTDINDPKKLKLWNNGVFVVEYYDALAVFIGYPGRALMTWGAMAGYIYNPLNESDKDNQIEGIGVIAGYLEPPSPGNSAPFGFLNKSTSCIKIGEYWRQIDASYSLKMSDEWLKPPTEGSIRFIPYAITLKDSWGGLVGFTKYIRITPFRVYPMSCVRSNSQDSKQAWICFKSNPRARRQSQRHNTVFLWQNDGDGISSSIAPIIVT